MLVADWFKVVGDRKRLLYVFLKNYVFFKEKDRGRNFWAWDSMNSIYKVLNICDDGMYNIS